ncbi:MAG: threonine transporter RhtB [Massilia sp.]|nr:threonine transporter RhtB [Massilia sp.]
MNGSAYLWIYFLVVLCVIVLPGLDMAFVLVSALVGGRSGGLAAVAGVVAGGICHVVMGALGVAAILQLWPALFNALLLGGAVYIAWIGWGLSRGGAGVFAVTAQAAARPAPSVFLQGMLTCLLNPKAYVFMLAIFPQFLQPGRGPLWAQAGSLGLITAATQAGVYGGVALLAQRASRWFDANPGTNAIAGRVVGAVLVCAGIFTAVNGWQAA